ncbi:NAD(P)/FAD-dependent oxidoreductase [Nitrincola sp.]|uniref:NAD(P)/FAD-dependent oxidoreductase n=1 Tax=Nitrincola sp. TaxID=1926584 RepID=UPI003A8D4A94
MSRETIVLGAGIVGVSIAWHLVQRGRKVLLIDRRPPGLETSFGNAGIIQREAVRPYAFPHDLKTLLRVLPNRSIDIRYKPSGMFAAASPLLSYYLNSFPGRYSKIIPEYASIIALSTQEHDPMIKASGADGLIQKNGWLELYRTEAELDIRHKEALEAAKQGVLSRRIDRATLAEMQPGLSADVCGAIHWQNSWTVESPGDLVQAYAKDFEAKGGEFLEAELNSIVQNSADNWTVTTSKGRHDAAEVVVALGPWSQEYLAPLNYNFPLFVKRGYHMHYQQPNIKSTLNYWIMDAEKGYLLEPMKSGIRLTTGAELANLDAPPAYGQLDAAEKVARKLFPIGARADKDPWKGARPCFPDMKPVIGPAPKHPGLWLAFGHGHQGFTLGPATGRLLGEMMDNEKTAIDMQPFRAGRF